MPYMLLHELTATKLSIPLTPILSLVVVLAHSTQATSDHKIHQHGEFLFMWR